MEAIVINKVSDDGGLDQSGSSGGVEKWLILG